MLSSLPGIRTSLPTLRPFEIFQNKSPSVIRACTVGEVRSRGVTMPKAIDKKYASETPGKGRLHTCVDSYHANKDAGTLNDLKWIQKGGGYWSLCNTALKAGG